MPILFFLLFPALELYTLIKVGGLIGGLNTVLLVFAGAALGVWVMRIHGQQCLLRAQEDLAKGNIPEGVLLENVLVFLAGVLLIIPGVLSDIIGLLLLVPLIRRGVALLLIHHLRKKNVAQNNTFFQSGRFFVFRSGTGFSYDKKTRRQSSDQDSRDHYQVFDCAAQEVEEDKTSAPSLQTFDCTPEDESKKEEK